MVLCCDEVGGETKGERGQEREARLNRNTRIILVTACRDKPISGPVWSSHEALRAYRECPRSAQRYPDHVSSRECCKTTENIHRSIDPSWCCWRRAPLPGGDLVHLLHDPPLSWSTASSHCYFRHAAALVRPLSDLRPRRARC